MKKRIFSLVLALAMMVSVSTAFADIGFDTSADPNVFYEGNKPFMLAEKLLDELNNDKAADIFDQNGHVFQYNRIKDVNEEVLSLTADDLLEAINLLTLWGRHPQS